MNWGLWIARGILSIVFGVLVLVLPRAAIAAVVFVFGIYAIVDGAAALGLAFRVPRGRGTYILRGILGIAAGIIAFALPGLTATAFYVLIGAWAVTAGLVELGAAIALHKERPHTGGLIVTGLLTLGVGILFFVFPMAGVIALLGLLAAFAILNGVTQIEIGVRVHELTSHPPTAGAVRPG